MCIISSRPEVPYDPVVGCSAFTTHPGLGCRLTSCPALCAAINAGVQSASHCPAGAAGGLSVFPAQRRPRVHAVRKPRIPSTRGHRGAQPRRIRRPVGAGCADPRHACRPDPFCRFVLEEGTRQYSSGGLPPPLKGGHPAFPASCWWQFRKQSAISEHCLEAVAQLLALDCRH